MKVSSSALKALILSTLVPKGLTLFHAEEHKHVDNVFALEPTVKVLVKAKNEKGMRSCHCPGNTISHQYSHFGIVALEVPISQVGILASDPNVDYVETDTKIQFLDPMELSPWAVYPQESRGQRIPWGITRVLQESTIPLGPHASDMEVCVIDTGYNLGHSDLPGATGTSTTAGSWNKDGHSHGMGLRTKMRGTVQESRRDRNAVAMKCTKVTFVSTASVKTNACLMLLNVKRTRTVSVELVLTRVMSDQLAKFAVLLVITFSRVCRDQRTRTHDIVQDLMWR